MQSLQFTYSLSGNSIEIEGESSSNSEQNFEEGYNVSFPFAIYDPKILNFDFSGRLRFNQNDERSKRSFLYNLRGTFLEKKTAPVNFHLASELTRFETAFGPGYDQTTDSYGIGIAIANRYLPCRIKYLQSKNETSGLTRDRISNLDSWTFDANHNFHLSQTDLNAFFSKNEFMVKGDDALPKEEFTSFGTTLKNLLKTKDGRGSLVSRLQFREEERDLRELEQVDWEEGLAWSLGKAFRVGLDYGRNDRTYERTDEIEETILVRTKGFWLEHRLFASLNSRLELQTSKTEFDDGTEDVLSGTVSFNYRKKLGPGQDLDLYWSEGRNRIDRDLAASQIQVFDEPLTVVSFGDNLLRNPFVVAGSIVVRAVETGETYEHTIDYELLSIGAYTGLDIDLLGSGIADGQALLVSYAYLVNPDVEYDRSFRKLGGIVSFEERRYRLFANFRQSEDEIRSGSADLVNTDQETSFDIGFAESREDLSWGVSYQNADSSFQNYRAVEGYARWRRYLFGGITSYQLRDRYSLIDNGVVGREDRSENLFTGSISHSRPVLGRANLTTTASFFDIRGDGTSTTNELRFDSRFKWQAGKLSLQLNGRAAWRESEERRLIDYGFYFLVTRFFY